MEFNLSQKLATEVELTPLPDALEKGYFEVISAWRKPGDKTTPEDFHVQLRSTYTNPSDWFNLFLTTARAIIVLHTGGKASAEQIDSFALKFLMDLTNYYAKSLAAEGEIALFHPGELDLPEGAEGDPGAIEVMRVWKHPGIDECPGCGESHEAGITYVGNARDFLPKEIGEFMADVVLTHCEDGIDEKTRLLTQGEILKAFSDVIHKGVAKA